MHFDPEHSFLLQVRGVKHVSVAAFDDDGIRQRELNRYYDGDGCDFAAMKDVAEDFRIDHGVGVYLPSFVPHWVTTKPACRFVSIPFYTEFSERAESVNRINHRLRASRISPRPPWRVRARRPRQGSRLRAMGKSPRRTTQGPAA